MRAKIKQIAQTILYDAAMFMELLIGLIIIAALLISTLGLLHGLHILYVERLNDFAFRDFLAGAFNVVIGIEFLKMLCRHTLSSVIEVLLFAIARGMVAEHTTPLENLLSIAAIAILFLVRKYLFPRATSQVTMFTWAFGDCREGQIPRSRAAGYLTHSRAGRQQRSG